MREISYQYPRFERLQPRSEWRGGRLADTDLLTLEEAAEFASRHAGEKITARDFLRAAGRGEITLRAIVHRAAKVRKHDGGVLFNKGTESENIVPAGAIPTLPLTACQHLANAGRASWRTFDGFEERNDIWMRYTVGMLTDDEPDFETVPNDCRVVGDDVHALADAFCTANDEQPQDEALTQSASVAPDSQAWTLRRPERFHGYTAPLYRLLHAAHDAGQPCPKARDVLEAWHKERPPEIFEVLPDEFKYEHAKKGITPTSLSALQKAIDRLTGLG